MAFFFPPGFPVFAFRRRRQKIPALLRSEDGDDIPVVPPQFGAPSRETPLPGTGADADTLCAVTGTPVAAYLNKFVRDAAPGMYFSLPVCRLAPSGGSLQGLFSGLLLPNHCICFFHMSAIFAQSAIYVKPKNEKTQKRKNAKNKSRGKRRSSALVPPRRKEFVPSQAFGLFNRPLRALSAAQGSGISAVPEQASAASRGA